MNYSAEEIMQYIEEEDVKFIRLAFCDIYGNQKNISVMPSELERVFSTGIGFNASAIPGFDSEIHSDLFLHPDPATLSVLPWRPEHGRVVRMFCNITYPNGKPFPYDTRNILKTAIAEAKDKSLTFAFGSEMEFYLFKTDENGNPTKEPYDNAGYMDIAPEDKGENVRREICLTLEQMGIRPESSHHKYGPGQNEINFRYADPLKAADDAITFRAVVKTIAARYGLYADFSPKPLNQASGNGMHINVSVKNGKSNDCMPYAIAGILDKIGEMTLFLNPTKQSYERLGSNKAPGYISWSSQNRSQLIRIPAAEGEYRRAELRSPDPAANPYLAYTLIIYAAIHGIENGLPLPAPADLNLSEAGPGDLSSYKRLPYNLDQAVMAAKTSSFISEHLPENLISSYCNRLV